MRKPTVLYYYKLAFILIFSFIALSQRADAFPINITDSAGRQITIIKPPLKVVSLVPSATEMLFTLGCEDSIAGITYHDANLKGAQDKKIVGGFFNPNLERISRLLPDMLILSTHHKDIMDYIKNTDCKYLVFDTRSIEDSFKNIKMFGNVFGKTGKADEIIKKNRDELALIRKKVDKIPLAERKRVMRLMEKTRCMTPGDDSFQYEMIIAAGGIPPKLGRKGSIVSMTLKEWKGYNPQVLYGCGKDLNPEETFYYLPDWRDVDAVKNREIHDFPCDLTCRASTNVGRFVSWLSSVIYSDEFSEPENCILPEKVIKTRAIDIDLSYIDNAHIAYSRIYDFINKTLVVRFRNPQSILSTLEGYREEITVVGNHYSPPPCWSLGHGMPLDKILDNTCACLGLTKSRSGILFTGADMDNLSVKSAQFRDMKVYALVTAGVEGNAMRMSWDTGMYYEPGTINIIILTNMALTPRAMTRAIISATEGKTAALWDMDVRSSYSPLINPATGTGTDNIIIVKGTGPAIDNSGGHTKMGELIASAVYAGVQDAILKQNHFTGKRDIFKRLKKRGITVYSLLSMADCECVSSNSKFAAAFEETLLDARYAAFLESAFSISDDYERGLVKDLESFRQWSTLIAGMIAGKDIGEIDDIVKKDDLPIVIRISLNAILTGVQEKMQFPDGH